MAPSPRDRLRAQVARLGVRRILELLTPEQAQLWRYDWELWARSTIRRDAPGWLEELAHKESKALPDYGVWKGQCPPPGEWTYWLYLAGRASGKTWTGSHWVLDRAERNPGAHIALVGPTSSSARKVMIKGKAGILRLAPPWFMPRWYQTDQQLIFPNGTICTLYTADEPERLRGPEHDEAWADEVCAWSDPEAWDQLLMTMRGGLSPRVLITTTPKPSAVIKEIALDPNTAITVGATSENAENLPERYLKKLLRKYAGTHLGAQELEGALVEDVEGALWTRAIIDAWRVSTAPEMARKVVAVDPSGSKKRKSALCGIVTVGLGANTDGYVLRDDSGSMSPDAWGRKAVQVYHEEKADCIVAEINHGGAMVETVIRTFDADVPIKLINASRGKYVRAEPVAALYEQGRIHHVGALSHLEDQQCGWTPESRISPDRMDALVHGLTELMIAKDEFFFAVA